MNITPNEYQKLAHRTAPNLGSMVADLQHAQLGLSTEVGEFTDPLKKHVIYGKPLDLPNMEEELGDILWYVALAATAIGANLETIMQNNIDKLRIRFPDKFTQEAAIARADKMDADMLPAHNLRDAVIINEEHNWGLTKEQQGSN